MTSPNPLSIKTNNPITSPTTISTAKTLQYHSPKLKSCDRKSPFQTPRANVRAINPINNTIAIIDNAKNE